jgi:hypothetical protein
MVRRDLNQHRVMIRCSLTGRAVPTGLTADPATWEALPIGLNRVACSDCKQFHAWSKNDASLEGSASASLISARLGPRLA